MNAGDFDTIYPLAVDIYADAHAVSTAFCEELNKMFQYSGEEKYDLIPIKSFVDMAVEAGVVKVENGMVSLTPEGEETARSVEREIKGGQN